MLLRFVSFLVLILVLGECAAGPLPDDSRIVREWGRDIFGWGIGLAGLYVGDIDDDNVVEIVAGNESSQWYILRLDESNNYVHEWTSPPFIPEGVERLVVGQLDSDAPLEIMIAIEGQLLIYDGKTHEIESELQSQMGTVEGLAFGELDGDPAIEAALCDNNKTLVLDLHTGEVQFSGPQGDCSDLVIGETDGTPGLEIVVASHDTGFVLNGTTGEVEWQHDLGFGALLALGDFDGDSLDEIAAGFRWGPIQVWDGDSRELAWEIEPFNISAISAADVEGDGTIELLYGDGQHGDVHVLDGLSGSEKWSVPNPRYGVTRIVVGDVNNDNDKEIIFGAGHASTGEDNLFVVDSVAQAIEWQSLAITGPFNGLAHGDIDADNQPELIYTSEMDQSGVGLYFIHDAESKLLEYQSPEPSRHPLKRIMRVLPANVDEDPALELLVLTSHLGKGRLQCIDAVTHEVQWEKSLVYGTKFRAVWHGDLDNDGDAEIVASTDFFNTGPEGAFVYIYAAESGALQWQSPNLQSYFDYWTSLSLLRVADIDNDEVKELLVGRSHLGMVVLDPVNETIDLALPENGVTALEVADIDSDGMLDIIIGNVDGEIQRIDPTTGSGTILAGPFESEINGLAVKQLTGDHSLDFVFAAGNRLHLVDGATGTATWVSEVLGTYVGLDDTLLVDDIDRDGHEEIWVNTGSGHAIFDIDELMIKSGFETP